MNQSLSSLSDAELVEKLEGYVQREKQISEQVVRHLAEMDLRKLYLGLGYASLFDYATRRLGYERSAAARRVAAARAANQMPEVLGCIERGELSLSTLELMAGVLKKNDGEEVLEKFRGKTVLEA